MSQEQESEPRAKADPSVSVFDLEKAFTTYFEVIESRDMQVVLQKIKEGGAGWKSAPKVDPTVGLHIGRCLGASLRIMACA